MTKRELIIQSAISWLLTPFHHEARIKGHGVDCLQLIIGVYQEAGLLPENIDNDVYHYAFDAHLHDPQEQYIEALVTHGWKEVDRPQRGDVALFKIGRRYSHGAIVIEWPLCVHAYIKQGVCYVDATIDANLADHDYKIFSMGEI